jgi:hypothetical protein
MFGHLRLASVLSICSTIDSNSLPRLWDNPRSKNFMQLPIMRCWCSFSGLLTVCFGISGYVPANKSLRLMCSRSRGFPAILDNTAPSFRRAVRIFLPITPYTFMSYIFELMYGGVYEVRYYVGFATIWMAHLFTILFTHHPSRFEMPCREYPG